MDCDPQEANKSLKNDYAFYIFYVNFNPSLKIVFQNGFTST